MTAFGVTSAVAIVAGPLLAWSAPALAAGQDGSHASIHGVSPGGASGNASPNGASPGNRADAKMISAFKGKPSSGGPTPYTTQSGNTCYYYPANYNPYGWYNSPTGQYDDYEDTYVGSNSSGEEIIGYTYSDVGSSGIGFGEDLSNWAEQQIGQQVAASGTWPATGATVTIWFPWHIEGTLGTETSTNSLISGSNANAGSVTQFAAFGTGPQQQTYDWYPESDTWSNQGGFGNWQTESIITGYSLQSSGPGWAVGQVPAYTLQMPAGEDITSSLWHKSTSEARSEPFAAAAAYSNFDQALNAQAEYEDYNEWDYNMPSGWYLSSCG